MKKYHIADLLTLTRFLIGVAILVLTFTTKEPMTRMMLLLFCVGGLTDAADGEFARRFKYPDDKKRRWWREYNDTFGMHQYEINDILADLMIGIAIIIYIMRWVNGTLGGFYLGATTSVGFYVMQTINSPVFTRPQGGTLRSGNTESIRLFMILKRRRWYVGGIVIIVLTLIIASAFPIYVTILLVAIGVLVGVHLLNKKKNTRLKQDKTPL